MLECVSFHIHMTKYIASRYIYVNSHALVAGNVVNCYKAGMKDIDEIRLENFRMILTKYSQAEIARRMGKTPPQIYQWAGKALGSSAKGLRNISSDTAREIESALGLDANWMDHPHIATPGAPPVSAYHPEGALGPLEAEGNTPTIIETLDRLRTQIDRAPESVRRQVMELVMTYIESPEEGARIGRAIEILLGYSESGNSST